MIAFISLLLAMETWSCSITHYCSNGSVISCTADGKAAHCDNGGSYVLCEYYDMAGNKQVIHKSCGMEKKVYE